MAVEEPRKLLRGRLAFARIRPDNIPSQRCFEKNGFQYSYQESEARLYPFNGSYHCYNRFECNNVQHRKNVHFHSEMFIVTMDISSEGKICFK